MTASFPSPATTGDTTTISGRTWTYNGSAWALSSTSAAPTLPWPEIAAEDLVAPTDLTFAPVAYQRNRDSLPARGPLVSLSEQFQGADLLTSRYTITQVGNTPTSTTESGGTMAVVGNATGGSNQRFHAHTKMVSPSGVFASIRVDPGWSGDPTNVAVGFGIPGADGDYIEANWRLDTGALNITTADTSGKIRWSTTAGTLAGPIDAPIWIGLHLCWPASILMTSTDGETWAVRKVYDSHTRTTSLLDPAAWAPFRPYFRLAPLSDSGSATISAFRSGYGGSFGYLNHRVITLADGTPYKRDGKHYLTCTVPVSRSFVGQFMAILSFDPITYTLEMVGHVLFRWNGIVGSASVGTCVYDDDTGVWHVVAATWGIGAQANGIDQIYGTTTRDLLSPGVTVIDATTVDCGGSTNSVYDAAIRRDDSGTWHIAAIETNARANWSAHNARYYTATDLATWTEVRADDTITTDGVQWAKIGGDWYILGGSTDGFRAWDSTLQNKTAALTSWSSGGPGSLIVFASFPAHPSLLVTDDGVRTKYVLLVYDNSKHESANGTRGGSLVMEATTKPDGFEHRPRLIPRYDGV
jgi:hypothetical protein